MASFFTFDRNTSTIAREFRPNASFGNAFSEIFSEKNFDRGPGQTFLPKKSQVPAGGVADRWSDASPPRHPPQMARRILTQGPSIAVFNGDAGAGATHPQSSGRLNDGFVQ